MRLGLAIILIIATVLISAPFAIPGYLGRGAKWVDLSAPTISYAASVEAFEDGFRDERLGDLEAALLKYRIAKSSRLASIQAAGGEAVKRVSDRLDSLGPFYNLLKTLLGWTRTLFWPVVLLGGLALLFRCITLMKKRSGIQIHRFVVVQEREASSAQFDHMLNQATARIARAFQSDQLRRIGAAATFTNLGADQELSGVQERAIQAMRQGDPKSILGFALSEIARMFFNIEFRPAYSLSGTVLFLRDEAVSSATLTRLGRHERKAGLDASSVEAALIETLGPHPPYRKPAAAADWRKDGQDLADLARVLACKYFILWLEMEEIIGENWPTSWQTVHDYVSAQAAIEAVD